MNGRGIEGDAPNNTTFVTQRPRESRAIGMSAAVDANADTEDVSEDMPYDGFVDGIIAGWPDGADQLVGVQLVDARSGEKLFPVGDENYLAYNDFSNEFDVTFEVEKGQELIAKYKSLKGVEVTINFVLIVKRRHEGENIKELFD